MRDDVILPPTMSKLQAVILIQKTWRGKRVRTQVQRVRRATKYGERGKEGEGEIKKGRERDRKRREVEGENSYLSFL